MHRWLHDNGLSLAFFVLFAASLGGQIAFGRADYNEEQLAHGDAAVGVVAYLQTGDFLEAVAENWESEFLQMAAYVLLTIFLFQRNLENISQDRESLIEEIRDTVYHEIAHHMGMDEDAVRQAEDSEG